VAAPPEPGYSLGMAGGALAQEVACLQCLSDDHRLTRATRVHEGFESDQYRCALGHECGIDGSRGPAEVPQWPAPPDVQALVRG